MSSSPVRRRGPRETGSVAGARAAVVEATASPEPAVNALPVAAGAAPTGAGPGVTDPTAVESVAPRTSSYRRFASSSLAASAASSASDAPEATASRCFADAET
jgi:hypothetical protein